MASGFEFRFWAESRIALDTLRDREVFFFQAEDGIRDHCVTGVQTCALPISRKRSTSSARIRQRKSTRRRITPVLEQGASTRIRSNWPWPESSGSSVTVSTQLTPSRVQFSRSEERRVGKEWSSRMSPHRITEE